MDPTIPHSGNTDGTNVASSTHAEASLHVQIAKPSTIGEPCTFAQGQFNGQTIRVVISEIQKADVGRKFATKDRRPLDPPPTVKLQIYQINGTEQDRKPESEPDIELNPDRILPEGWTCFVDLFVVKAKRPKITPSSSGSKSVSSTSAPSVPATEEDPSPPAEEGTEASPPLVKARPLHADGKRLGRLCTADLAGNKFVQAMKLPISGSNIIMFSFSDLSIRTEGEYVLRYRVFDVLSVAAGSVPIPVLAECIGRPFRVYTTKEFPGLGPTTALTKAMTAAGVRFNMREGERKGHSASHDTTPSSHAADGT